MRRHEMKIALALLLALQMIIPMPLWAAAVGQFSAVAGDVKQTSAGVVVKPVAKSPLQVKDLITTGDQSTASLLFDDESTIALAPNSRFEIKDFYIKDNTRKGLFSLSMGRLVADVKKWIGGHNAFEIHSPTAIAGVRGTGFIVAVAMVGGQMTTTVTCTSGALTVTALSATGAVVGTSALVVGQTAVITSSGIVVTAAGAAAGAGVAAGAGATAGVTTAAGIGAGTITVGVAAAAVVVGTVMSATGDETTAPTHHSTPTNH